MPGKKSFKKIFLSVSNSGAKDAYGISMKMTKALFKNSEIARTLIYRLFAAMARTGLIPKIWKVDIISFLYKKKGSRKDAKNWRPITIAASFGKHFEKLTLHQMRRVSDMNTDNHAYITDCSCLTAVLAVMEFMRKIRKKAMEDKEHVYVPYCGAEDIGSAFESIDHELVITAYDECLRNEGDFDLAGVLRSYFKRDASIVTRSSDRKEKLYNTVDGKTSPQGSTLSPALWRVYDKIFSEIYKDELRKLKDGTAVVDDFFHVAYADDHVTIIILKFKKKHGQRYIRKVLGVIISTCRNALDLATIAVGCGINAAKSEVLLRSKYVGRSRTRSRNLSGWATV